MKNWHDSFINIASTLYTALDKAIPDQFKPVQQIGNCGFGNHTAQQIVDELFHTYGCATATDISKIDDTIKILSDPNSPIEILYQRCPNLCPLHKSWI